MTESSGEILTWVIGYVLLLLVLGGLGRRARESRTLSDHFLANRSIGFLVLLMTLFATQYSGNSLSAFPGRTYRGGLAYFMSVTFMVAIIAGYTLFAPKLYALSRKRAYLTPTDYLIDRFKSPVLGYVSAAILAVSLVNYLLAQLMAMGHAFAGITNGQIPYVAGVVGGAVVILVYEIMGGMRAVAWTDALQGLMLAGGLLAVVGLIVVFVGTPGDIIDQIGELAPEKIATPSPITCASWMSMLLLLGLAAPLYPQAIQRIYAARRLSELRNAMAVMAFLPLFAVTAVVFIGLAGIALFPDLDRIGSDQVTFLVLARLLETDPSARIPVLIVMMGVAAAIMSTADSALLSLSSIITKDFTARIKKMTSEQADRLTGWAGVVSVVVMSLLVLVALVPRFTLWRLLEIKFEILIQLSPAFVLGTLHEAGEEGAFHGRDVLAGLAVGLVIALGLTLAGHSRIFGFHAGVLGVVVNYLVVLASRRLSGPRAAEA